MMIEARKQTLLPCVILMGIVVATALIWSNQGYGKVSAHAYELSKAIYGACLSRSEERIEKIEFLLTNTDTSKISKRELKWLGQITQQAKEGNWESASLAAKEILDDQIVE